MYRSGLLLDEAGLQLVPLVFEYLLLHCVVQINFFFFKNVCIGLLNKMLYMIHDTVNIIMN